MISQEINKEIEFCFPTSPCVLHYLYFTAKNPKLVE